MQTQKIEVIVHNANNRFAMLPINFPETKLQGSEKQVVWAQTLIHVVKRKFVENNNCWALRIPSGVDLADPRMEAALEKNRELYQKLLDVFFANTDASVYINAFMGISTETHFDTIVAPVVNYGRSRI